MRTLRLSITSFILIFCLCISLWSPADIRVVEAEGVKADTKTTAIEPIKMDMDDIAVVGEGEETPVTYSIEVQDESATPIVDVLSLVNGGEKSLSAVLKPSNGDAFSEGVTFDFASSNPDAVAVEKNTENANTAKLIAKQVTAEDEPVTIIVSAVYNDNVIDNAIVTVNVTSNVATKITIEDENGEERTEKDIVIGETYDLGKEVKVAPAGAVTKLTYSSRDENIATVDGNGVVKAIGYAKEGTYIDIKDENSGLSTSIAVFAIDIPVSIKLNKESHSMKATDTFQLEATLVYASGKEEPLDFDLAEIKSSDESIVKVDEKGLVEALVQSEYPKQASVMVSYNFEQTLDEKDVPYVLSVNCMITVTKIPVEKITLKNTETSVTMKINDQYTLKPVVAPANATNQTWKVKNSDKDAVSTKIVNGEVVITAKGMAKEPVTITIYAEEDSSVQVTFTVNLYQTVFNVVEIGVNATDSGAKSDSNAINDILWYATCIDEPITVVFPDGNYYIDKTLKVYTETNIVLGDNAVIKRKEAAGSNAMIVNRTDGETGGYGQCRDITITGGTWDGNASGAYDGNCMYFGHAQNITITNTKIINNSGAHLIEFAGVKNALVENVELYGYKLCTNKDFISSGGVNADKEAIQIDVCSSSAPAMKPWDGTPCDTITIRNCNIHDYMAGIGTHTSMAGVFSTNVRIENNTFTNIANACINLRNFNNVNIENNTAKNCTTFLYASESQGVIKSNKVNNGTSYKPVTSTGLRAKNGITVSNGSDFTIEKNTFQKAKSNGICVWNGSVATVKNNTIKNNKLYGIRTQGSTITLKKNKFSKNKKGLYDTYKDAKVKSSDDIRAYYIDIKKSYKYKGKAVKPKIKIKNLNKKYYKVTYKNNKKPGTATVVIKGKGKVKQTLKIKYKIKK